MAKNTAALVRSLIGDTVKSLGCEIWDVEFVKEGGEWFLRVTIDKPEGVDITDCEAVSRAIDPILDEADPIEQSYRMEVSSPGIERELRLPEHFTACIGETIILKLFTALDGQKQIIGALDGYDTAENIITITDREGNQRRLARNIVSRANIYYEFQ